MRSDLVRRPVDVGNLLGPLLVNAVAHAVALMIVRCFLYVLVVPCVFVQVIAPHVHVGRRQKVGHALGLAIEDAVYHREGLCADDALVRAEGAVGVAVYPAVARGKLDVLLCPVAGDVAEGLGVDVKLCKARYDRRKLRTGDALVRLEAAVGVALDDAHVRKRCYRAVAPHAGLNVGEVACGRRVLLACLVGQQAEEDSCDLCAADVVIRADGAVGVADDVVEVDLLIEDLNCLENAVNIGDLVVCGDILALCVLDDRVGRYVRGLARLALDAGELDGIDLVAGRETFDGVLIAGYGGNALGAAGRDGQRTLRDRQNAVCLDDELNVREARVGVLELIGLEAHLVGSGVYAACESLAAEGEVLLGVAGIADLHGVVLDAVLGAVIHDAVAVAGDLDRDLIADAGIYRGNIRFFHSVCK